MLTELYGSRSQDWTLSGGTATREFAGDWESWWAYAPMPGEPFPGYEQLICCHTAVRPLGTGTDLPEGTDPTALAGHEYSQCRVTAEYKLDYRLPSTQDTRVAWDISSEVLSTAGYRVWGAALGGNAPDPTKPEVIDAEDVTVGVVTPNITITIDSSVATLPVESVISTVGKVNSTAWYGYAAETLLFLGGQMQQQFSFENQRLYPTDATKWWTYLISYKFLWRPTGHNYIWRTPLVARDADGNQIYYQSLDSSKTESYTTAAHLIGRPKIQDGRYGWYRVTPNLYSTADFNTLIPESA